MSLVDQRSVLPALDRDALNRVGEALNRPQVVAAMLIGSQARGTAGRLSDIDIGVWHLPGLASADRIRLRRELYRRATEVLGTDEVDVVLLNDASPLFRHRAVRDGLRLIERDAKQRVRFEARALTEYLDTQPLRDQMARGLRNRIREGNFGRRREH